MRRPILAVAVVAFALSTLHLPSSFASPNGNAGAVPEEYRVQPGKRIGKVGLGDVRSRIHALLGRPPRSRMRPDGLREDSWWTPPAEKRRSRPQPYTILFKGDRAVELEVSSPAFRTPGGFSIASPFGQLVRGFPNLWVSQFVLGDNDGTCALYYDDVAKGIAFSWTGQDEVLPRTRPEAIIVHSPGTRASTPAGSRPVRPPDLDRTGAPFPYTRKETLGKSEAQIVAMGRDNWVAFFTDGDRDSTTNAAEAETIYGVALERRNRGRIARLPRARQGFLARTQNWLKAFETHVIELHATLSGGGDTFRSARAAIDADTEEVIGRLTGDRGPAPASHTTGEVERRLSEFETKIRKSKADRLKPEGETFSAEYGLQHLREAREAFRELAATLKSAPRAESDLVLGACIDRLEGKLAAH